MRLLPLCLRKTSDRGLTAPEATHRLPRRWTRLVAAGLRWAAYGLATVITCLVGAAVLPAYLGYHQATIYGGSMGDALPLGSVAVTKTIPPDAVQLGDIIAINAGAGTPAVLHRVVAVEDRPDEGRVVTTRGDANAADDPEPRVLTGMGDTVVYHVPLVGYLFFFVRTPEGVGLILLGLALMMAPTAAGRVRRVVTRRAAGEPVSPKEQGSAAEAEEPVWARVPSLPPPDIALRFGSQRGHRGRLRTIDGPRAETGFGASPQLAGRMKGPRVESGMRILSADEAEAKLAAISKQRALLHATPASGRERWASYPTAGKVAVLLLVATVFAASALPSGVSALASSTATAGANAFTAATMHAPTGVSATGGGSSITLNWTATVDGFATGYHVFRSTTSGGPYTQIAVVTPRTTVTYTDSPPDGTYYYVLRSYIQSWESADSSQVSAAVSPVAFRAAASAGGTSGVLSLTINKPSGTVQNDVMIAAIAIRPNTATITAPSGWTLIRRIDNASIRENSLAVYRKSAGSSEPASYTWTFSTSTGSAGGIISFSGADTSSPVNVENGQNTPSGTSSSTPAVTTTVANTMLVTVHDFASAATWTPPAGMTQAVDIASDTPTQAIGISLQMNCAIQASATSTGVKTASASGAGDVGNAEILALKRAP